MWAGLEGRGANDAMEIKRQMGKGEVFPNNSMPFYWHSPNRKLANLPHLVSPAHFPTLPLSVGVIITSAWDLIW